jgi:hypothetical protein
MRRIAALAAALALALPLAAAEPVVLKPGPKTVAWGYYDASTPPVLRVKSGDVVEIHTLITSSPRAWRRRAFRRGTWRPRCGRFTRR